MSRSIQINHSTLGASKIMDMKAALVTLSVLFQMAEQDMGVWKHVLRQQDEFLVLCMLDCRHYVMAKCNAGWVAAM